MEEAHLIMLALHCIEHKLVAMEDRPWKEFLKDFHFPSLSLPNLSYSVQIIVANLGCH